MEAAGTGFPGIEVWNVTTLAHVTNIQPVTDPGKDSSPQEVAVLPDNSRVYVTLNGTNQFAVIDNTAPTPVQITGSPFNLPDPAQNAGTSSPFGVTIPPLNTDTFPGTGYRIYIAESAADDVVILDDLGNTTTMPKTPAKSLTSPPIALGANSAPASIAHIPVPK